MAGIQRFVTYIYAYEREEKKDNVGYAKIETRGKNGRAEVHFTGNEAANGTAKLSFLLIEDGRVVHIPLGEFQIEGGRGIAQFTFQTEMLHDTNYRFEQVDGIGVVDSLNQSYMSFWKEIDRNALLEVHPKLEEEKQGEEIRKTTIEDAAMKEAELESLHTMEIPMRNVFPTYTMEDIWSGMGKGKKLLWINEQVCAIQIELNDLRELPKKYWYLGNNSFLLHGFFNYRHLLLGKLEDGRWFLGVPGVFERQERVMASVFGFPGFFAVREEGREPSDDENERREGIWYHILEE